MTSRDTWSFISFALRSLLYNAPCVALSFILRYVVRDSVTIERIDEPQGDSQDFHCEMERCKMFSLHCLVKNLIYMHATLSIDNDKVRYSLMRDGCSERSVVEIDRIWISPALRRS